MKRFLKSKKGLALLATLVVVAASAIGAYAFFTNTGTTTNATADAVSAGPANHLTVAVSTSGTALAPSAVGDANAIIDPVQVVVTNANEEDEHFSSITVTENGAGAGCDASNFTVNPLGANSSSVTIPVGGAAGITLGPDTDSATDSYTDSADFTLQMIETGLNQNPCESANVSLTASAN